ncbi:Thyroid adenoma-associated protein-like protein [Penaeus vannamei]|uniref:Thyroid adenoma-associated protein-like protein n=1 Tax=Penaeus vannamei TaxID=6689 RepID=A0A423TPZ2_PENVA|nr:Thyroid adenoma-associated protein-like protein [Penaeus vannamei]
MDTILQEAVPKLFGEDVNQKIVRRISKDLENLKDSDQELLVEEISSNFRKLLNDDPGKALVTATLLTDGNHILKRGLSPCVEEVLKVCCIKIDSLHVADSRKQSEFHIAVKAVYGIVQYVLPLETEIVQDLALQHQLKAVCVSLLRAVVLHMWLVCVRKYGNLLKEVECDKEEKTGCSLKQQHPASWSIFTLQANDSNTIFHLLNSNWENPAKGVSDVVYTCMSELLELHDDRQPGQAKVLASNMLDALVTSAAWTSKSTYPPLGLAISFVGANEALQQHPVLANGLTESLKVNHLASAGTNVYKIVLSQLSVNAWHQHFLHIICDGLHSQERMIQQHILTLWLPPTLRQYGSVYQELIALCRDCSSGWLARMAILRVARSLGVLDLEDNSDVELERNERQEASGGEQFEAAQDNLLQASQRSPIHGSLMALGYCLCRDVLTTTMSKGEVLEFMTNLTDLLIDIIEYMLSKLACASPNGSAFAPSFAEMGESIEIIIKECESKGVEGNPYGEEHLQHQENVDITVEEEEEVDIEDNAISGNHQLILACCWQTMKACCAVTSMSVTHWIRHLSESLVEKLLHGVVVRVLTGTRHKGAMEAARASYGQLCSVLLSSNSNLGHLIYKQVNEVLDHIESGAQTSVTRRAAGIAMMMQVACGAAPRTNVDLINTTVLRLIRISQSEYEEQNTVDASPVLALHMLQSLVLHAPLAHHLLLHLPAITSTCLQAFTNHSWALRNAALQLYGAVVPRMVGQKKVRDDSSVLNSLTAPEFLARHPSLAQSLLKMLMEPGALEEETLQNKESSSESEIMEKRSSCKISSEPGDSMSIKVSSSLVPVLSLLARLSPGTGLQQNAEVNDILQCYRTETTRLLESPIHTVRRLASLAVVALTPSEDVLQLVHSHVELLERQGSCSAVSQNRDSSIRENPPITVYGSPFITLNPCPRRHYTPDAPHSNNYFSDTS